VLSIPFGGTSPFRADVYFVNRKVFTDLKWGTKEPVAFRDSELSMGAPARSRRVRRAGLAIPGSSW
jgi:membrane protease subunit (stomatin/prohibitin family)